MKPYLTLLISLCIGLSVHAETIYDYNFKTLQGKEFPLSAQKGKVLFFVNVASKCGLTKQYKELQEINKIYQDKGLSMIGFPCNDFGGQEPGSAEEIIKFCSLTYGVDFPLTEKITLKEKTHPLFQKLIKDSIKLGYKGKAKNSGVRWNFEKFIISKKGELLARFPSKTKPNDPKVIDLIEKALKE